MSCSNCKSSEVADLRQKKDHEVAVFLDLLKCHECSCVFVEFNFDNQESHYFA